jgi:hypothetical protein
VNIRVLKRAKAHRGIFSFSLVYNEEWFLPHFLAHYRGLGVEHFVFFDDHSDDRTREILMEQDDCTILVSDDGSPRPRLGVMQAMLGNHVLDVVPDGEWGLHLDVDEFLVLPTGFTSIEEVAQHLEQLEPKCAMAAMVDFYPERLSDRFFDPLGPMEGSPWFDRDPVYKWFPKDPKPKIVISGVRPRLLQKLAKRFPEKIGEIYGDKPYRIAKTWKVPLVKTGEGIVRLDPHNVNVRPSDSIQLGLAHFKFYPGLDARVQNALHRQGYFQASVEYRFLDAVLSLMPDERLVCPRSVQFRSPADLEQVGHIWVR